MEISRPTYSRAFHCVGPECEDTCCQAWGITVDQAAYQRYQLLPAESLLRPIIDARVELLPEPRTEARYAHILLDDNLQCPFLTTERWCAIQQERGPEFLSKTCASYPRATNLVDAVMEESLQLSCPEAARLVLLDEHLPGPELSTGKDRYTSLATQSPRLSIHYGQSTHPRPCLAEIRAFLILLLRDREYPLWQRLFLIGQFCNRLQALLAHSQPTLIPKLIADYASLTSAGTLRPIMDRIPPRPEEQLAAVLRFIDMRMSRALNSLRFLECTRHFLSGIGYHPGATPQSLVPAYIQAFEQYYQPLMHAHPHLMENYLLNHIFKSVFPFGPTPQPGSQPPDTGVFHEYLILCTHYALLKGLLIGISAVHREQFSTAHVVKLVQSYGRMIEHHERFVHDLVAFLETRNMSNTNGIVMLLRN